MEFSEELGGFDLSLDRRCRAERLLFDGGKMSIVILI